MADPKTPTMPDALPRTMGEVQRKLRGDEPGGRGVPDARHTFAEEREENLGAGRQAARQAPTSEFQQDEEEASVERAATDEGTRGERGGPSPRE